MFVHLETRCSLLFLHVLRSLRLLLLFFISKSSWCISNSSFNSLQFLNIYLSELWHTIHYIGYQTGMLLETIFVLCKYMHIFLLLLYLTKYMGGFNKHLITILKIQIDTNIEFGGSTTRSQHALEIQRYNIHVHVLEIWG